MKIYMIVIVQLVIFAACYGFIIPAMVSAKDSIAVIGGLVVGVVVAPLVLLLIGKYLYTKHIKTGEEE